ncbi:MAG: CDP-glycerol glycerophosphotransferase family protein, partial [Eubacterium sp.]|nr:CDP-glycerol glycerophosphotransferase family protein [Eubacterium sp.]
GNLARVMEQCRQDKEIFVSKFLVPKTVSQLSRKELRECARLCARARVIVLEDFYPQLHSLTIRPQTKIVQLWHACGVFKTFGYSRLGKPGVAPQSSMNHRNYDLVTVSSEAVRGIYAEAFAITVGKVKPLGAPRTDVLFDKNYKDAKRIELYEKYPQLIGHKVILFAPTFRGDGNKDAYYPEDAFDVNLFMDGLGEDVCCIVKHHPFVHQEIRPDEKYADRVLDLTGKDHINDLMLISDLLITDYSSSVFEAVLLGIPMLFYAFDKEDYIRSRDFYCDYDSFAPGYVEEDFSKMEERARKILNHETEEEAEAEIAEKRAQFFHDFLSALDGRSTERIVNHIKGEMLTKLVKRR